MSPLPQSESRTGRQVVLRRQLWRLQTTALAGSGSGANGAELCYPYRAQRFARASRLLGQLVWPLQNDGAAVRAGREGLARESALWQAEYGASPRAGRSVCDSQHTDPDSVPERPGGGAPEWRHESGPDQSVAAIAGYSLGKTGTKVPCHEVSDHRCFRRHRGFPDLAE